MGGGGGKESGIHCWRMRLNYGVPISVAFYGRGEMTSKYVATRIMCVRVHMCVTKVTELARASVHYALDRSSYV